MQSDTGTQNHSAREVVSWGTSKESEEMVVIVLCSGEMDLTTIASGGVHGQWGTRVSDVKGTRWMVRASRGVGTFISYRKHIKWRVQKSVSIRT